MMWKTRIHPKTEDALKACKWIVEEKKDPSFTYNAPEEGDYIDVFSPNRNTAYKRGSYFRLKFGLYYEVMYEKEMTK